MSILKRFKLNTVYLFSTLFIVSVILDLTISYSFFDFSILQTSFYISRHFLPVLVTILGIFFAVYLLMIQLFRGRYPLNFIKKYFNRNFKGDFTLNIILAAVLMIIEYDFSLAKIVYIIHFSYTLSLIIKSYNDYRLFDPANKINEYEEAIKKEIDSKHPDHQKIANYLEELTKYAEDSLSKKEIFLAKYILKSFENLMIHFMQNKDTLIIEKNDSVEELQENFFKKIISQLKYAITADHKNYAKEIFASISKILRTSVECNALDDFEIYSDRLKEFFDHSASQREFAFSAKVITLYKEVIAYVFEKEKEDDWVNKIRDNIQFFSFNTSEIYFDEELLKNVYELHYLFLQIIVDKEDLELYEKASDELFNFVNRTFPNVNNNDIKYLKIYNVIHTSNLVELENSKFIKIHLEFLKDVGKLGFNYDNTEIYRFILEGFDYIINNCEKVEIKELVNKYKFAFVLKALENEDGKATYFIPDYEKMLKGDRKKDEKLINKVTDGFENLLKRTLYTKSKYVSLYLFKHLNKVFMIYEKSDLKEQKLFLNLYEELLYFGLFNKDTDNFHLILEEYQNLFFELDKEGKLSKKLFGYFISIYRELSKVAIEERLIDFVISINRKLFDIGKDSNLISKKTELKKELNNTLFQIGVKGVENRIDDIIRNSSDKLGWLGKEAIENERHKILENILDKAVSLMNLSQDLKINEGTIIFNGTLFVVLGGYAHYRDNQGAISKLKAAVANINCSEKLYSSKLIRDYESEYWDDLMGGDASKSMDRFYNKLTLNSAC